MLFNQIAAFYWQLLDGHPAVVNLPICNPITTLERLTRFGFRYLDTLLKGQGRALEVVNKAGNETEDVLASLTSTLYSLHVRLYGQRRSKRKTEALVRELEAGEGTDATG